MPRVSVITPLFNKGPYVAATLRSVAAQTCADWEMLVVDNGSTDDGPEIVRQWAATKPRVRLLTSPRRGPGAARNFGLAAAGGEWVLFLDADDLIEPAHLARLLAAARTEAGIVAGGWREFREGQPGLPEFKAPAGQGRTIAALRDSTICFAPWCIHAALVRRALLSADLGWAEELDNAVSEDTAFWFKLITRTEVAYSDSALAVYRVGTATARNRDGDCEHWQPGVIRVVEHNLDWLRRQGRAPTSGQAESLMRLYSGFYLQARAAARVDLAAAALTQARCWLVALRAAGGAFSWPLRIRRWLGLRLFLELTFRRQRLSSP